jgi:hypothetical protein
MAGQMGGVHRILTHLTTGSVPKMGDTLFAQSCERRVGGWLFCDNLMNNRHNLFPYYVGKVEVPPRDDAALCTLGSSLAETARCHSMFLVSCICWLTILMS